ncbi:DUF5675 family protein [Gaetbulibacter sp. M240]|uniref:DUF5675 family protein n=1 Tax=Gaetbulibacter sp. M240 TaxID=3126511 RepID=UPI00374E92A1
MDLVLHRTYFKEGTNGALFINYHFFCFTIELPWLENEKKVSCIPEGTYEVVPRFSEHFKHHLLIKKVPNRQLILIHGGNDAHRDLEGCIAPVSYLSGLGKGLQSQAKLKALVSLCYQSFDLNDPILLTIKS